MIDESDDIRKVRMSKELMDKFASRDPEGNRVIWNWGEPDEEGFYTPTLNVDFYDNWHERYKRLRAKMEDFIAFIDANDPALTDAYVFGENNNMQWRDAVDSPEMPGPGYDAQTRRVLHEGD